MDAQEIIDYIANAPKKTPVRVFVREREGAQIDYGSDSHVFGTGSKVVFGDWSQVGPALSDNADDIEDVVVECDRRNSGVPMLDVRGVNARIEPGAILREQVEIGDNAVIMMGAVINIGAVIGAGSMIDMGAVLGGRAMVGAHCHVGAGCVLAGVVEPASATPVVIEDDVEIGANTCIDRAKTDSTVIRRGVKLDNLVQIAHNTDIGANTVMSSQVGVAGSTKVGEWCMFGGQVGIAGHITIGDKVFLGAQSGVPGSLKSGQQLIGTPPMEQRAYFKSQAIFRRLPDMYKELNGLKKQIEELKKNN